MKVWRLGVTNDGVWVEGFPKWDLRKADTFDGRPHAAEWTPERIVRLERGRKPLPDAPTFLYSGILILSEKACTVMAPMLEDSCELLPLVCDEGEFAIVNVTAVLDCIDYGQAAFEVYEDSGQLARFTEYVFLPEKIAGHDIFKIKEFPLSWAFVTDRFKDAFETAGLTGLRFELVWDSEADGGSPAAGPSASLDGTAPAASAGASRPAAGASSRPAPAPRDPEAWRRAPGPMAEVLEDRVKAAMAGWDAEGIYAASLYAEAFRDNPCTPAVTLSYNTEAHAAAAEAQASSPEEARWNYAFWPQEPELYFGEARPWGEVDDSPEIVERWVRESGFPFYTYEEMFDGPGADDEAADGVPAAFMLELAAVVRDLHASGFVRGKFGRDIPVLVHGLEYSEADAELNLWANGACAEPFAAFCREE